MLRVKYVGNNYDETEDGYVISQAEYVTDRLKSVDVDKGTGSEEAAPREVLSDNWTAVGCLSWVAKETRPEIAFAANVAQPRQNAPSVGDIKVTKAAVKLAREYQDHGVMVASQNPSGGDVYRGAPRRGLGQRRLGGREPRGRCGPQGRLANRALKSWRCRGAPSGRDPEQRA